MITKIAKALEARKMLREDSEKGFTLIELLVVVLIIGILSAIAIPIFLNQQASARDSEVQSDVTNFKVAVVAFIVANPTGSFPTPTSLTDFTPNTTSNIAIFGDAAAFCISGYNTTNTISKSFAASDKSGTVKGTCNTTTFAVTPATP